MNKTLRYLSALSLMLSVGATTLSAQKSEVWVSDNGDGTYTNPIINADYSDPDVVRVGDDYYMTSSSFNCLPGLQILHSKDLVNWTLVSAAIANSFPIDGWNQKVQHGNAVWAPSIRYHEGEYYIYYGDPDHGVFMTKTKNPAGEWEPLHLVYPGKGMIDAAPLWDEDGNAYLVHGIAGSRAGFKSLLCVAPMVADGKSMLGTSKVIFDGHDDHVTVEGPKFYKRNGYYYIFAPAGGVATGWQLVLRSKNPYGPYEEKIVMAQGGTNINGPHQGAWVDTPSGEDWFIHFQDKDAYGRVVHLQPMAWKNDWPVIGVDKDGDGCGEPVMKYKKPNLPKQPVQTPADSDEFNDMSLGLQWQWHGEPSPYWAYNNSQKGYLRMFSVPVADDYKNLADCPNLLLQKFPAENFVATTKFTFTPNAKLKNKGEKAGLIIMGLDYATLTVEDTKDGLVLSNTVCKKAIREGAKEEVKSSVNLDDNTVYLQVKVNRKKVAKTKNLDSTDAVCQFYYSVDGKKYQKLGGEFEAKPGQWIGAKAGLFVTRPIKNNDGGWIDVDYFRITKK